MLSAEQEEHLERVAALLGAADGPNAKPIYLIPQMENGEACEDAMAGLPRTEVI